MSEENFQQPEVCAEPTLAEVQAKCDEYLNSWKRAQADYLNLQKQLSREREDSVRFATARALEGFLPVFDHFGEALRHEPTPENFKTWLLGVKHIQAELNEAIKELGVERMKVVGQVFDPARHESVGARAEAGVPPGLVLEERQAGFEQGGRVLRPAKVIISE